MPLTVDFALGATVVDDVKVKVVISPRPPGVVTATATLIRRIISYSSPILFEIQGCFSTYIYKDIAERSWHGSGGLQAIYWPEAQRRIGFVEGMDGERKQGEEEPYRRACCYYHHYISIPQQHNKYIIHNTQIYCNIN